MRKHRLLYTVIAGIIVVIAAATLSIRIGAGRQQQLVEKCKTLRIGMAEHEIGAVLGQPTNRRKERDSGREIEILVFEPPSILPNPVAQPVYLEIDASSKTAIRIVCDEIFHLHGLTLDLQWSTSLQLEPFPAL